MLRFRSLVLCVTLLLPAACKGQSDAPPPARADTVSVRSGDADVRAAQDLLAEGHP